MWNNASLLKEKQAIKTKLVFKNQVDEDGKVVRQEKRLAAQGYSHEECIDYMVAFALVARLEAIRILLSYVAHHKMILYQMDIKSAFLNGFINEEVFIKQPPRFEDVQFLEHVLKLKKTLYGL